MDGVVYLVVVLAYNLEISIRFYSLPTRLRFLSTSTSSLGCNRRQTKTSDLESQRPG